MGEYMCDPFEDFMNALEHCDTVTVSLKEVGETSWDTETIYKAILRRAAYQKPTASAWRTDEPYMNGVPFLAACSDGVVRIARYDQVLGKTGYWTLDRATIVPNIIAWALIHPYEGVE